MSAVLTNKNTRYLFNDLRARKNLKFLSNITNHDLEKCMVIPIAIARWIDIFRPELKNKSTLNIVLAGAEIGPDQMDNGIWYQIIPELLCMPELKIQVTMVGPHVHTSTRTGFDSIEHGKVRRILLDNPNNWSEVSHFKQTIGEYINNQNSENIDLVFLSHPGFENAHFTWFSQNELAAVIKLGIPVGACSYDIHEFEHESWLAKAHGYEATDKVDINPFSMIEEGALVKSSACHTLWEFTNNTPGDGFRISENDKTKIHEYEIFTQVIFEKRDFDFVNIGIHKAPFVLNGKRMVSLPDQLAVDLDSGVIYLTQGSLIEDSEITIPKSHLDQYPINSKYQFEKILWTAKCFILLLGMIEDMHR